MDKRLWIDRAAALGVLARRLLSTIWRDERIFLLVVVLVEVFFARRSFRPGIWADNDSVCHYAYLRHLVEDVYPATGSFLAYSPKFNMGVPFLLYNTPPGLYVSSAVVASIFHLTALTALKICVVAGYVSVPVLGFAIAKTYDDAPEDTPKFVAAMLALFSSELYGLEFFFRNGMLNPALGVPLMLATMYFFRRAQTSPLPTGLRHLALGALFFAATACTHLLSTYMLCLALGAFVLGTSPKAWGGHFIRLGAMLGLGGGLAAFWLVPSAPFAAKDDAAYTWLREPVDTLSSFLDGSILSSYFAGFFPTFVTVSNVGVFALWLGAIALVLGLRTRAAGPLSTFLVFALGAWIMVGPTWSLGIRLLPGYDRLLWYRFLTLAEVGILMLGGFGAAYVAHLGKRFYPYNRGALLVGFTWAFIIMLGRAAKVETAGDYPEFVDNVDRAAGWLREHGDKRARVFDEFLGQHVVQPPSVNYTRHMMPMLSGFSEIGGWIYENNLAGQVLMKKGVFWYSPFPILDEAPIYNVKYIVAGSPHFIRALSTDPRWRKVLETRNVVLFEHATYEPSLVEGRGLVTTRLEERYLAGGGYEYEAELGPAPRRTGAGPLTMKVGYLPFFEVTGDGKPLATRPSKDGLLEIDLPEGTTVRRLRCVWDISTLRTKGNRISLVALALAALFVAASFAKRRELERLARPVNLLGVTCVGLAVLGIIVLPRKTALADVGFGIRGGMSPYEPNGVVKVGAYDDSRETRPLRVLDPAWSPRTTLGREPARKLAHPELPAFQIALPRRNAGMLVLHGEPAGTPIALSLAAPGRPSSCNVQGALEAPIQLPATCLEGELGGELPGVTRDVTIRPSDGVEITVSDLQTDGRIKFIEAESLRNVVDDGGYDAFYVLGPIEARPSNGIALYTDTHINHPVDLDAKLQLGGGHVEVWVLTRTLHPRFYNTRAEVSVYLDEQRVGGTRGAARKPQDFWERDTIFEWIRLGEGDVGAESRVKLRLEKVRGALAGLADVDALAIVPM